MLRDALIGLALTIGLLLIGHSMSQGSADAGTSDCQANRTYDNCAHLR